MAKRKVTWVRNAEIQMLDVMDYYYFRNKSMTYSLKLRKDIQFKLHNLNFTVTLPKKTSIENLFYFTHNHICVMFCFEDNDIVVQIIWDERRNPNGLKRILDDM